MLPNCEHRWFSGRILACHAGDPGSIPGRCKAFTENDGPSSDSSGARFSYDCAQSEKFAIIFGCLEGDPIILE